MKPDKQNYTSINQCRELFFHMNQNFAQDGTKSCGSDSTATELEVNNTTGWVNDIRMSNVGYRTN
jgi:hypothetical protein